MVFPFITGHPTGTDLAHFRAGEDLDRCDKVVFICMSLAGGDFVLGLIVSLFGFCSMT